MADKLSNERLKEVLDKGTSQSIKVFFEIIKAGEDYRIGEVSVEREESCTIPASWSWSDDTELLMVGAAKLRRSSIYGSFVLNVKEYEGDHMAIMDDVDINEGTRE